MKVLIRVTALVTALLAGGLGAAPAFAIGAQDQTASGTQAGGTIINSTQSLGQTFTAGKSGLLDRVTLNLQKSGTAGVLNVAIYTVVSGSLSGSALATQSVAETSVSAVMSTINVDFSSPATVIANTQYAIVVAAPNAQPYNMMNPMAPQGSYSWSNVGDPLSSETGFVSRTPWTIQANDFAFTTFVTAPQQPQTITWVPTNTNSTSRATSLTPDSVATTSGDGAITYVVQDAGTTGCALSSTPPAFTFTSHGTCVIRATAASTAGYTAADQDVTFTITESLATPVVAESAVTGLAETGTDSQANWMPGFVSVGMVLLIVGRVVSHTRHRRRAD